ncbi:hypothetical protein PR003_g29443, partial [Phytophthora rubi]
MAKSFVPFATTAALAIAAATAASLPDGTWPASTGTVQFAEARIVKAGEVFDGKMQTYERSDISCEGQTESSASTAVFKMEPGATLKNVIIGKNQMEGVHCDKHDCTIENVWWDDVCEDALSIKGGTASSVSTVIGCGARFADDKVIQHNGYGTVKIDGFYGEDISKLYRSCGTCGDKQRKVSVSNVYVVNPGNAVVTVNKNWNDEATLSNVWVKSSGSKAVKICQWSQGNANGEPSILGHGPSPPLCQYSESDVHVNEDISQAAQTSSTSSTASSSDTTQTAASASTASSTASSSDTTQAASSASTAASTAASSSQVPTQESLSFADSSLASSASASSQASSNSSADASDASGPGTVAPVETGSLEQSVVSSAGSQTEQQQDSTEQPTAASSPTSSSGSANSPSDDVTQTAVQQSSVASSSESDVSQTDVTQTDVELECDSSTSSASEQTSQPSSVASSSATDPSQADEVLECDSSAGSSKEQVEVPSQQSTSASASTSSASNSDVQSQQETTASGSSTASSAAAPSSSRSSSSSSGTDPTTQSSSSGSSTQSSSTGSAAQTPGSQSTEQTTANTTVGVPDGTWPTSTGSVKFTAPHVIKAGEVFDGKMQTFDRSDITCTGGEGQKDTAVFLVEAGGTLKNAIIGKNQKEGVHCDDHDCTIENVWWDDVCEDALSVKGGTASSVTTVTNCGARYASDKVVQHNGHGTVKINGFFAQEFGKLYRSCGTCGNIARTVTVENVYAIDPL